MFVALLGAFFGLLGAPTHGMEQTPDVVYMVVYAEALLDDLGNAGTGPKVGVISVGAGALEEAACQTISGSLIQFWGPA